MATISLCMVVKNNEKVIGRCLETTKELVDEIIIVDLESIDRTMEIAGIFDAKTYDFKCDDDFSAARNYSFSKACMDYILWLDPEDVLLEEDSRKFKELKDSLNSEVDVVMMKHNLGTDDKGHFLCTVYRERLIKRNKNFKWKNPENEYIEFGGNIIKSEMAITHKRENSLMDGVLPVFDKMVSDGKQLSNQQCFLYARELLSSKRIEDAIIYFDQFLNTSSELISDYINAAIDLAQCYLYKGEKANALKALIRSFEHDAPQAEICCRVGYCYKYFRDYAKAITWFKLAMNLKRTENSWSPINCYYRGYIPCIEISVCYSKLGYIDEAIKYNEKALAVKPNDLIAIKNRHQFLRLKTKNRPCY